MDSSHPGTILFWTITSGVASIAQAVALFAAAAVAWWQIAALRRDQRAWETLKACERYDSDLVLSAMLLRLRDARDSNQLATNPRPFRFEMSTILNYLEGIAIGLEQNFYNERVVRDHLEPIMRAHYQEFLVDFGPRAGMDAHDFNRLRSLINRWDGQPLQFHQ